MYLFDKSKDIKKILSSGNTDAKKWVNEAIFGFEVVKKHVNLIPEGGNILEVGCGSGILLKLLSTNYKHLLFEGIEPFNKGFTSLKELNDLVEESGISVINKSYENINLDKKYDLIFCINVFEHLNDWRDFIEFSIRNLKKNGKLVIACPNYDFPYESHFKIPFLINKKLTFFFFQKHIFNFENKIKSFGLWESINFVKKSEVFEYYSKRKNQNLKNFTLYDDLSIIDLFFERIRNDNQLKKRQKVLTLFALLIVKFKLVNFVKLFPIRLPYMKLIFKK